MPLIDTPPRVPTTILGPKRLIQNDPTANSLRGSLLAGSSDPDPFDVLRIASVGGADRAASPDASRRRVAAAALGDVNADGCDDCAIGLSGTSDASRPCTGMAQVIHGDPAQAIGTPIL